MSDINAQNRELITALSRDIVGEVAEPELEIFDDLVEDHFADPTPPDMDAQAQDSALGFGLGEVVIAATPAATAMVSAVMGFVVQMVIQAFQDESTEFIRGKVKGIFQPSNKPPAETTDSPITFSSEQLKQMRAVALEEAKRYGMQAEQAAAMADALFRRMVLDD